MSNPKGLRRALSPKRSLRLDPQASEGSGLSRISLTGSRKRSRKQSKLQTYEPAAELDPQQFYEEWKLYPQDEDKLLTQMQTSLEKEGVLKPQHDIHMLRRFLRARGHDLAKAKAMFLAHIQWEKDFGVAELDQFEFTERDAVISVYPQGYHKVDKQCRPIYIQHLGQVNIKKIYDVTTEDRMLKFHVQEWERCIKYIFPACSKVAGRHIDQIFSILDVKGVGIKQVSSVKQMLGKLTSLDSNNYPEMLGRTCIINAPPGFGMMFGMIKPFLDVRTRAKVEVCPKDYMPSLLKWVDPENLPRYLGGTSDATLIDDAGPWNDPQIRAEIEEDIAYRDGTAVSHMSPLAESPTANSFAASSPQKLPFAGAYVPLPGAPILPQQQSGLQGFRQDSARIGRPSEGNSLTVGQPAVGVPSGVSSTSPFAAHAHQASFDQEPQFTDANEYDDASEYDDATSRLGSMSMSSMYASDDESTSPPGRQTGGPGFYTQEGTSTADVRLQDDVRLGQGAGGGNVAAWKAANEYGLHQHPGDAPPVSRKGKTILERVRALETQVPALQQRASLNNGGMHSRQGSQTDQHSLIGRVEALEEAVDVLLQAQEQQLDQHQNDNDKTKCSQCCVIM